jgi:hypothetical protein
MSDLDESKRVQEIITALEAGGYNATAPPGHIVKDKVPLFTAALSDEARGLSKKKSAVIEPGFVMVQMAALWPMKAWYQETFAHLINNLVVAGVVESITSSGAVALAGGGTNGVKMDDGEAIYCGPDQYGVIFTVFNRYLGDGGKPSISVKELEAKYGYGAFSETAGEIIARFPSWFTVVNSFPENSLAERLLRVK